MITVQEVIDAVNDGKLQDAFGAGTAATIAPIAMIDLKVNNITFRQLKQNTIQSNQNIFSRFEDEGTDEFVES